MTLAVVYDEKTKRLDRKEILLNNIKHFPLLQKR